MSADNKRKLLNFTKLKFYNEIKKYQQNLKPTKEIEGYGGSAIVGEKNYPFLKIHNISTEEKNSSFFNTSDIVKKDYSQIFKMKAKNILGSTDETYIKKSNDRIKGEIFDIYKAKDAVEFNSRFEKELKFDKVLVNKVSGIVGSKNPLLSLKSTENIGTSKQIEKYTVNDIKSREAIIKLYERGTNEHQIMNILALGGFGVEINKKMVPTRWAISAYDQTIEKYLNKQFIKFNCIENFEVYTYKDKGNEFVILLIPDTFSGEVIEAWDDIVERDYVAFDNKLHKVEPETAGGFYATKIGIFESFMKRKRQSSFVSARYIKDYDVPLGVVFVRECVRESLKKCIFKSSNEREVFEFLKKKFPIHYNLILKSKVFSERKKQRKIGEFL